MTVMKNCPLVMIQWEDSRRPDPNWVHLSDLDPPEVVKCASVGWLVHDDPTVKALAPNMGDLIEGGSVQASGIIRIPARCVVALVELDEPDLVTSSS